MVVNSNLFYLLDLFPKLPSYLSNADSPEFFEREVEEIRVKADKEPDLQKCLVSKKTWDEEARCKWNRIWSPLHSAASNGNLTLIKVLVEEYCAYVNVLHDYGGWTGTPLHAAINQKQEAAVQLLASLGANPSLGGVHLDGKTFLSAVNYAEKLGFRMETVVVLLKKGNLSTTTCRLEPQ